MTTWITDVNKIVIQADAYQSFSATCEEYCGTQTINGFNYGIQQAVGNLSFLIGLLICNAVGIYVLTNLLNSRYRKENCDTEKKIEHRKIITTVLNVLHISLIGLTAIMFLWNYIYV